MHKEQGKCAQIEFVNCVNTSVHFILLLLVKLAHSEPSSVQTLLDVALCRRVAWNSQMCFGIKLKFSLISTRFNLTWTNIIASPGPVLLSSGDEMMVLLAVDHHTQQRNH